MVAVAVLPLLVLTVIVALPAAIPVTLPNSSTVATFSSSDPHLRVSGDISAPS